MQAQFLLRLHSIMRSVCCYGQRFENYVLLFYDTQPCVPECPVCAQANVE